MQIKILFHCQTYKVSKSCCIHHGRVYFFIINFGSLGESLGNQSCLISCYFSFLILFSNKYPFIADGFDTIWYTGYRSKNFLFYEIIQFCLNCVIPLWPIFFFFAFLDRVRFFILIFIHNFYH